jgi:ATP-dependent Clp protease ATP-binding subunit ClpA
MVLSLAAREAKALNHTYVGTEHILLGLLREGDGVAARVLNGFKIELEQLRAEILNELVPNSERASGAHSELVKASGNVPLGPLEPAYGSLTHQALALAAREADWFNASEIHVRHLLLGMLRLVDHTKDSGLGRLLVKLGVDTSALRFKLERTLTRGGTVGAIRDLPYAQITRTILTLAAEEAKELNCAEVQPEHLLLGTLREGKSAAVAILKESGIELTVARKFLVELGESGRARSS